VGAHNGIIHNDDDLAKKYNRKFEVDSMHLIAHIEEGKPTSEISGYGAVTYYKRNDPSRIYIAKGHSGDMSIVGPRPWFQPELDRNLEKYPDCEILQKYIFKEKPGITGLWQIRGRNKNSIVQRFELDYEYINIGRIELNASDYSLENQLLPVKVNLQCQKVQEYSKLPGQFYSAVRIQAKMAENLYKTSITHDLYIRYLFRENELQHELSLIFSSWLYLLHLKLTSEISPAKQSGSLKTGRLNISRGVPLRPKEFYIEEARNDCNSIDTTDTFRSPFEGQEAL
jgi:hypothetical protein